MARTQQALKQIVEERFLKILENSFGKNLVSVTLYGSYVGSGYVAGVSDINVLILLEASAPEQIELLGMKAHGLIRKYRITPLILTREEFLGSADVFPMEYMDIKERHRTIHGSDQTDRLELNAGNLRHQLEDRLRGNLASLRQLATASRGKSRRIRVYLKNSYGSLGALFRGLLRAKNVQPVPVDSDRVIDEVGKLYEISTEPFTGLVALRKGGSIDPRQLLFGLLSSLESLISRVDTLKVHPQPERNR
jgi:predicted nucleotidyltransferase